MKKPIQAQAMTDNLAEIAQIIELDWSKPYFGAVPYIKAMKKMQSIEDFYYMDSASTIILYFLANASTWRGDIARATKAKLKQLLSSKKS